MSWLSFSLALSALPVLMCSGYLGVLTILSRRLRAPTPSNAPYRFAVVVPAHDEARGIAATVTSLKNVDYRRALFRVIVVADNCAWKLTLPLRGGVHATNWVRTTREGEARP